MQRLIRFKIRPVDHDQRLEHCAEQFARQRGVNRACLTL